MDDQARTNPELIKEISALKQRIVDLEQLKSERKRASGVLRQNEGYFKAIIQNASDIILVLDRLGTITYASSSVELFLGYKPDEVIGKRTLDLIVSEDQPRAIADFGKALLTKEVLIHNVFRIRHKNGTKHILEGIGTNLLDNPIVAGFVMNLRDITDHKKMEEALQESENRYRSLVENANDIILKVDETGLFTFANSAALRITGYEAEEIIGKHYPILIHPDRRDDTIKFFGRQFVKGIKNTYFEYPVLTKDQHEVWLGQNTQLIVEDGRVMGFQAVARDITDRKKTEEALSESEERYRTILDNIEDGYYEVDLAGNLTFFNDSLCRLNGYPRTEMMGVNYREYTDKENSQILYRAFNKVFITGDPSKGIDYEIIGKDGTQRYIESSVSLIRNTSGQPIGFRGIIRNITERKQAEEALRWSGIQLHAILESTADGILAVDNKGGVIKTNRRFADLWRIPQSLMDAGDDRALLDFVKNQLSDPDAFLKKVRLLYDSNKMDEDTVVFKDGRVFERFSFPMIMEGVVIGRVWSFRDITERKRIEEELKDSEERYRRIIEASSDAILLRSKENIIYANPTALKLFRANHPEDLIGKQYLDLVHPDDRAISAERVKKTMNENWIAAPREHRMLALDGQVVHVESTGVPVKYRGETHIFGIFRNITERKLAEQEKAILAGIERLISSTLEIDKVYERFATEAHKMIPFDRLTINLNNHDKGTVTIAYVFGSNVSGRIPGDSFPLQGSVNEALERTRTGMLFHLTNVDEITGQYSSLISTFQAGIRSFMSVPLISQDKVIGVLHFRSKKPDAYKEHDLRLAEKIGLQIAGAIANAQLYADLKKTENSLRESEGRFRALIEQAAVGVAEIVMETGQFITVNRRLCEIVGRTEEELLATTFQVITHPEDLHLHEEKTALLAAGEIGHYSSEKRYVRKDGETVWVSITVSPLWKPGEKPGRNMVVVEDISERKKMEAEMREMSLRDLLTDLYNRRGFIILAEQQLKASNRAQKPLKLTFIDCDGLKWINDTLGHKEGDKALIDTANVLRQTYRDSDIIARFGGDEFAVLSIDAADMSHEDFSRRLQQHIDGINERESRSYKLSLSWGTAMYHPESPTSLDQLISAADELMYDHKKAKRNRRN